MAAVNLTKSNFDEVINQSDKPVLVDFWASWCAPCRMLGPTIEQVGKEYGDKAIIAKVNVEEEGELAQKFGVMSIPNVIIFKNGKAADNSVGVRPKKYYTDSLNKLISEWPNIN